MPDALVTRVELGRLPFKRRPIAEPGTRLVFQLANGALVCPDHPYTSGETWFRGPKAAYVVDTGMHDASFETELPSASPAVYFTATISYQWQVHDPARVVRDGVTEPERRAGHTSSTGSRPSPARSRRSRRCRRPRRPGPDGSRTD